MTPAQKEAFKTAVKSLVEGLRSRSLPPELRIKGVQGHPGVFEMSWTPDGRATWEYGPEQMDGEPHIIWRRVGTHAIFTNP